MAKSTSVRWTTLIRLRRTTVPRCPFKHNDLRFGWNTHPQPLFGKRQESRARRSVADLLVQLDSLALEIRPLSLQRSVLDTFAMPVAATGDHRDRSDQEPEEQAGDDPPATLHTALRHARSRALLARGFLAISPSDAVIDRRVMSVPSARPRHVHCNCRGGHIQSLDHSRISFFTRRSSPE